MRRSKPRFHRTMLTCSALLALSVVTTRAVAQSDGHAISNTQRACEKAGRGSHEAYRLPPPPNPSGALSFGTDWTGNATGGWFGRQAIDGCRIRRDGFETWHKKTAIRIEVQPGDDPLNLNSNSERAEMLIMQDARGRQIKESAAAGKQFYATSYYFPEGWQGEQLPWSAFAPTDCATGDQNQCNSWSFVWQFYGWAALSAARSATGGPQQYKFNERLFTKSRLIALGRWTDFVFFVDWTDGSYTIWRRDQDEAAFTEVLTGKAPVPAGRDIYVKQGLYRGANVHGRTDVLWIGPTVRGSSFSDVEHHAFGTNDGPAAR